MAATLFARLPVHRVDAHGGFSGDAFLTFASCKEGYLAGRRDAPYKPQADTVRPDSRFFWRHYDGYCPLPFAREENSSTAMAGEDTTFELQLRDS